MKMNFTRNFSRNFVSAVACIQIFSGSPEVGVYHTPREKLATPQRVARGTEIDMPENLSRAVAPLQAQGFYILAWEVSPASTGYMVDLYHSDPARLGSRSREDVRLAILRGTGLSLRKFIRVQMP